MMILFLFFTPIRTPNPFLGTSACLFNRLLSSSSVSLGWMDGRCSKIALGPRHPHSQSVLQGVQAKYDEHIYHV